MKDRSPKVAIGLSGGVDSSVAAAILKQEGYDVIGISMQVFDGTPVLNETKRHACYGPGEKGDLNAAELVCKKLSIPFHIINLKEEFKKFVIEYFKSEYLSGRTPNPCVVCNHRLKFGLLPEKAAKSGVDFEYFATGHYARVAKLRGRFLLQKASDTSKDQSYFLYRLTPRQLSRILFPLGRYTKEQVRKIARSLGLETADRPESQDFVSGRQHSSLFEKQCIQTGDIVDEMGNILGTHKGIVHYTIGQRKGLGLASPLPLYVVRIDSARNRLVVGQRNRLLSRGLIASELNLMAVDRLERSYKVKAKIRLKHKEAEATLTPQGKDKAVVVFDQPQLSVTPGQAVVLYHEDAVFGGGVIERVLPLSPSPHPF